MPPPSHRRSESGYTLAALLVILSILAVVLAFTVPRLWSDVMQRERDLQTIHVMKQYARAIAEFQRVRGALPTSLEQLEEQKRPRVLRRLYENPLSGELDWVMVSPQEAQAGQPIAGQQPPQQQTPQPGTSPTAPRSGNARDYRGPFVGVRPPNSGKSFVPLNGIDRYDSWTYTIFDLQRDTGVGQPQPGQPGQPPPQQPPRR